MGKRGVNAYSPEDHRHAFMIWKENKQNMSKVSRESGMPARQTLYKWAGDFPECTCQWHNWQVLVKDISKQVLANEYEEKYGNTALSETEQKLQSVLEEYFELIKDETLTLKFLKQLSKFVMETMITDIKREKQLSADIAAGKLEKSKFQASKFRPKNLREAIGLMDFILKQTRICQNLYIPPELLEGKQLQQKDNEGSNLNLSINLENDEILGLLGSMYKDMDKKVEGEEIDNLLSFRPPKGSTG